MEPDKTPQASYGEDMESTGAGLPVNPGPAIPVTYQKPHTPSVTAASDISPPRAYTIVVLFALAQIVPGTSMVINGIHTGDMVGNAFILVGVLSVLFGIGLIARRSSMRIIAIILAVLSLVGTIGIMVASSATGDIGLIARIVINLAVVVGLNIHIVKELFS